MEAVSCGYYDCWPQTWPDLPSSLIRIGCLGAPYMPLFSVSTNRERFIFYLLTFLIPFFSSHEIKTFWSLTKLWQSVTNLDKATTNPDSVLKSRDITLPTKVCIVKAMVLPVVMDRCESWTIKRAEYRRTDAFKLVLETALESPLDCKEIKSVNPKGNQPWVLIGRTDAEAETPILWPPDVKSQLIGKDPDAGKDWRQKEKGATENERVR